ERLRSNPISIPPIAEPMSVTAMMPMITPRAVSAERILCARMMPMAMRKDSVSSSHMAALRLFLLDHHLRPILQAPRDGGVRARHDLVSRLHARLDLDEGVVGDAGVDFLHLHLLASLDEYHALQLQALGALLLFLERFIRDIRAVVAL